MKTIYKYPLKVADTQNVVLPVGAKVLCVQTQNEVPCLWALVDNTFPTEIRCFCTFGTGHEYTGMDLTYVGTYQLSGGELVFHVFEAGL